MWRCAHVEMCICGDVHMWRCATKTEYQQHFYHLHPHTPPLTSHLLTSHPTSSSHNPPPPLTSHLLPSHPTSSPHIPPLPLTSHLLPSHPTSSPPNPPLTLHAFPHTSLLPSQSPLTSLLYRASSEMNLTCSERMVSTRVCIATVPFSSAWSLVQVHLDGS